MKRPDSIYRLRHKHSPGDARPQAADADVLISDQSLPAAAAGAAGAVVLLIVVWVYAVMLFDQFFPWISIIQGYFIGRAVQHFGRGIDWRFPVLAAGAAMMGAFLGSFFSALFLTGREFGMNPFPLLAEVSWHTLKTFSVREFGLVGVIYAGMSASIAAFFAGRRLTRQEAIALRKSKMDAHA